ncbi:hypothetical protein I546_3909 [Mycobacterium kansasii 732]|nr:hypothetical protein I546_3909 [Mycobacterium kansasii 732]
MLKRQLIGEGITVSEGEMLWVREPRGTAYRIAFRGDAS